jgi:hypothetical protein
MLDFIDKLWDRKKFRTVWFRGRKRCFVLSLLSIPMFATALKAAVNGDALALLIQLGLGSLYLFSLYILRQGLVAAQAYELQDVAKPPAWPRKTISAIMTGAVVTALCLLGWKSDVVPSVIYGVVVAGLQYVTFGADPQAIKGVVSTTGKTREAVVIFIEDAVKRLERIETMASDIADRDIGRRLTHVIGQSRTLIRHVQNDPEDYREVQKFFNVYMASTQDAVEKLVKLDVTPLERTQFVNLLNDLDQSIVYYRQKLTSRDKVAFDVELEVLSERLKKYQ